VMAAFLPLYFLAAELCIFYLPKTYIASLHNFTKISNMIIVEMSKKYCIK